MVVFVDHGSAYADLHSGGVVETALKEGNTVPFLGLPDYGHGHRTELPSSSSASDEANANANADLGFSVALGCYPVVTEIARSVDLNTLHALSRACRQFRANLLQFRNQLVRETLRCHNDVRPNDDEATVAARRNYVQCARDMVGECQRCTKVICRNCTMKLPHTSVLKNRLRRLCPTCLSAPLAHHFPLHSPDDIDIRSPGVRLCSCETHVWLCKPCGHFLRNEDTGHKRVWTWRSRYSTYLGGGIGAGVGGGGSQGVVCGRGDMCLAAEDTEVEVDCEVDEWTEHYPSDHHAAHDVDEGPGYLRQEIEGIGGVLKQKVKKWVRVGAGVNEFDGERESGGYLLKEASGDVRSWCPWCWRVVPSDAEMAA